MDFSAAKLQIERVVGRRDTGDGGEGRIGTRQRVSLRGAHGLAGTELPSLDRDYLPDDTHGVWRRAAQPQSMAGKSNHFQLHPSVELSFPRS